MNNVQGFGRPAGGPGGGGAGQGEPSCSDRIAEMWAGVPLFNRFIFWTSLLIYLISFVFEAILYYTLNIPYLVITKFQIWRLVTAPFANPQLLMLLFGLLSYMPRG